MPTGTLSNHAGNLALSYLLSDTLDLFLALHQDDPGATGDPSAEVAGGGYARQSIGFTHPSAKGCVSNNKQRFAGLPQCTVTHAAVWDGPALGKMIVAIPLTPSIFVPDGGLLVFAYGDLAVQM